MELLANLIALGFAAWSLIGALRWIDTAAANTDDPAVHRAKRGFFIAFAAILVLFGAMFAVYFAARPQGHILAGILAS